jgi:hypothetical protein
MFVNATGGGGPPFSFQIPRSDVQNFSLDIFGNSGVWATGSDPVKNVKTFLVSTFCRGNLDKQDDLTGGSTGGKLNRVWNDWLANGANFYQNLPDNFLYAKFIHDFTIDGSIDNIVRKYAYGFPFDDVYEWSATIASDSQAGGATQAERLIVDIYTNDNMS